jgi:hypothetical protein
MEKIVLKKEIIKDIKEDGALFGKIADTLKMSPISLPRLLYSNDEKLTQASVLRTIKDHLGYENESDLLEVVTGDNNNTQEPQLQETH